MNTRDGKTPVLPHSFFIICREQRHQILAALAFWGFDSPVQSGPSSCSPLTTITDRGHLRTTLSETLPRTRLPILPSPLLPTRTMSALTSSAHSQILSTTLPERIRDWILTPAVPYL